MGLLDDTYARVMLKYGAEVARAKERIANRRESDATTRMMDRVELEQWRADTMLALYVRGAREVQGEPSTALVRYDAPVLRREVMPLSRWRRWLRLVWR